MKIALGQINPTVGDFAGNTRKILEGVERAAKLGASLVVFPELAVCGYPPADLLEKADFLERAEKAVSEIAAWTAGDGRPAILCGTVMEASRSGGKLVRNVAVLLDQGKLAFVQQKMLLPFYDVFDEQRYFEAAEGQSLVTVRGQTVAITICEDAWNDKGFWPKRRYTLDPVEELMGRWPLGRDDTQKIMVNLSASPYWLGKRALREEMLGHVARRDAAVVVMVNQVGGNDSLIFDGSSFALDAQGRTIARAASFAEDLVLLDTEEAKPLPERDADEEDIAATWDALVLGVRDYVGKCGFRKVTLGLSGGIDSALVAALAVEALGAENVMGVGMPSEYSSTGSVDDARALAENLGIRFEVLAIREIVEQFGTTLGPLFAGTSFGLAEENMQARIRGVLLMALSNKFGSLVLTTGNKSEMSTGYCTLYGDMVGGLAVIGDVMKTRVYKLSRYANRVREVIPVNTIEKPPSAELRPDQKDTDSLPPYEVLDPILESYVENYLSAEQIAVEQGLDVEMVRHILKMVERAEYKRQQAAPVLKVTKKSFGNGRRFPIAAKVAV
ncbi:NAD+ synthase (glutamine-hydrolysing) [Granulicella pectinivorans]|uniref:Glutamine-dependent NAD(+) synthetase n=1 Tax=Granulicella pectinivorans TaxID=474950 RepID=A0A1I6MCM2_9BACT|nr:NAD+ synthase [Granulicella pectinivorans]SFS13454.1 NAD+ synthase (glutamine-hydrolysing) [Granulicella pectinivorans]